MIKEKISGISNEFTDRLLGLFLELPKGSEVILFGSRAKGHFREGSDIDLAIKSPVFTIGSKNQLLLKYEDLFLPWKLDLVIYDLITEDPLRDHIDRVGKLLFVQNK